MNTSLGGGLYREVASLYRWPIIQVQLYYKFLDGQLVSRRPHLVKTPRLTCKVLITNS